MVVVLVVMVEWGGGVEEGNSLKKHYVTEECVHGSVLRGHGLEERKRVLLAQIWRPGRLTKGPLPPVCFLRLYSSG